MIGQLSFLQTRGKDAIAALEKEGLNPKFHLLNISDEASIVAIRDFMKTTYGGIDVLVNNAAIAIDEDIDNIHVEVFIMNLSCLES